MLCLLSSETKNDKKEVGGSAPEGEQEVGRKNGLGRSRGTTSYLHKRGCL